MSGALEALSRQCSSSSVGQANNIKSEGQDKDEIPVAVDQTAGGLGALLQTMVASAPNTHAPVIAQPVATTMPTVAIEKVKGSNGKSPSSANSAEKAAAYPSTEPRKRRRASAPAPGAFAAESRPKRQTGRDRCISPGSQLTLGEAGHDLTLTRQKSQNRSTASLPGLERQDSLGLASLIEASAVDRNPPALYAQPAAFLPAPKPGTLPDVPRQVSQTAPEHLPGALTDTTLVRSQSSGLLAAPSNALAVANGAQLKITLTQGTDRSQGWMRANGRSTVAHLEVSGFPLDTARKLREVFLTGERHNNPLRAYLRLDLLYADTEDPVLLKMHGRFMDKLDLMLPNGSSKNSHEINVNWFAIDTADGVSHTLRNKQKGGAGSSAKEAHDLRAWKPSEFLEVRKPRVDDPTVVEASVKFSTNITSRAHSKRLFFWRASLTVLNIPGHQEPTILTARTPEFEYRPRPPQEDRPTLREVLTDGKPGDMIVCNGDRIADGYPDVKLVIWHSSEPTKKAIMPRTRQSKTCYVAHLPLEADGIQFGQCFVHLVNPDADVQTETMEIMYGNQHEISPLLALSTAVHEWNENASADKPAKGDARPLNITIPSNGEADPATVQVNN